MIYNEIDQSAFERAKIKVLLKQNVSVGFGTLQEKTIHSVMKLYYEPNEDYHEIPIEGYIADIYNQNGQIIEVQNGNFNKMRGKLQSFLPSYVVTIVYPLPRVKWLIWVDPETGNCTEKRKSPKTGNGYEIFKELYKIKSFLHSDHLCFRIPLLDMEEYRLLNGYSKDRKKGSERYDRMPVSFQEEIVIESKKDFMMFVPASLEDHFTCNDFSKAAKIKKELASVTLNILTELGIVKRVGKQGRSFLYEVVEI